MSKKKVDPVSKEIMPISNQRFDQWYNLIVSDELEAAEQMLSSAEDKTILLNGEFSFEDSDELLLTNKALGITNFKLTTPLCLAGAAGSAKVLGLLIYSGVDVCTQDVDGCNILHALTGTAVYFPDQEQAMVDVYASLCMKLDHQNLLALHLTEETCGMRPLEFAAKQGTYRLMMAYFDTPGVYLARSEVSHSYRYKYYDVTDYESMDFDRDNRSPLVHLMLMERSKIEDPFTLTLFQPDSLIHEWVCKVAKVSRWPIFLWFIIRMSFFTMFFLYDSDEFWLRQAGRISEDDAVSLRSENITNSSAVEYCSKFNPLKTTSALTAMSIYLGTYWLGALLLDLFDISYCFRYKKYFFSFTKTLRGKKKTVDRSLWYRMMNILSVNFVIWSTSTHFMLGNSNDSMSDAIRVMATVCAIWSPLYFVQLIPGIGYFVITIQRMMEDMYNFLIVFAVIILPFSQMLLVFVNTNSLQGCVDEFSSFSRAMYSVILVMQNMLDLSQFNMKKQSILLVVHVTLIFLLPIVLVNFLIATMSSSVSAMVGIQPILSDIQFLQVAMTIQGRLHFMCKPFNKWMIKRYYVTEGDRVYVVCREPISRNNKE